MHVVAGQIIKGLHSQDYVMLSRHTCTSCALVIPLQHTTMLCTQLLHHSVQPDALLLWANMKAKYDFNLKLNCTLKTGKSFRQTNLYSTTHG